MPIIVYSGMIIQCFISALTMQYLFTTFVINVSATEQYLQENTNYKKKKKRFWECFASNPSSRAAVVS